MEISNVVVTKMSPTRTSVLTRNQSSILPSPKSIAREFRRGTTPTLVNRGASITVGRGVLSRIKFIRNCEISQSSHEFGVDLAS